MPGQSRSISWINFKKLAQNGKQSHKLLALVLLCIFIESLGDLSLAIILRHGVDALIGGSRDKLIGVVVWLAGVTVVLAGVIYSRRVALGRFAELTVADLRQKVVEKINCLPISYIEQHDSGDVVSRLTNDTALVRDFLYNGLMPLIYLPFAGLLALIAVIIINWQLTLAILLATPVLSAVVSWIAKPIHGTSKNLQTTLGEINVHVQDAIAGSCEIKAFDIGKAHAQKLLHKIELAVGHGLKLAKQESLMHIVSQIAAGTPFFICFGYGGYLMIRGIVSIGSLFAFINLLNHVSAPVTALPRYIGQFHTAMAGYGRIQEVLDAVEEPSGGMAFASDTDRVIEFNNVNFNYGSATVLTELSFEVRQGETVAIVGPSGSGKSTILKLISGFYQPQYGTIKIFGHDLNQWNLASLRSMIAIVNQEAFLFPETIKENIAYGLPNASEAQVIKAARLANAHEFIIQLPNQYETIVGEWGSKLSGGQKQRVAIARALLKNAKILLLDEPTSALDSEAEHQVQIALERLTRGKTTLIVAHRLSTIINADRILVVDQGRIVETGTHEQLLRSQGLYFKLYQAQAQSQAG